MIIFVVYETKLIDSKLTFQFLESFEQYDDAKDMAEAGPHRVVIPFDDDDTEDDPLTYFD